MVVELVTTIFLVLICTNKNYAHRTDMGTDADEVKHRTVDVGDEEHQESGYNGNDEGNLFGFRYLQEYSHLIHHQSFPRKCIG